MTDQPAAAPPIADIGRRNMHLLIQLRWIAVFGQLVTIAVVHLLMGIRLPIPELLIVPALLIALNLASLPVLRHRRSAVANTELFAALLLDVGALTWQLHLSGGITNPFALLFLLQVVLAAMLLKPWTAWIVVAITNVLLIALAFDYRPLEIPTSYDNIAIPIFIMGRILCFALIAVLMVQFLTRITKNLRESDGALAHVRQQAAEENHIVRMGLLASGAAHELGTPLASISVILGDWQRMPQLAKNKELAQDIADMQGELARCKNILSGILMSAGEARGEAPEVTTIHRFLDDVVDDWRARLSGTLDYENRFGEDVSIVSDPALKQVIGNVIDNAVEASPHWIGITARRENDALMIEVDDRGPGFTAETLAAFGQPYNSSKGRPGGGLGLFLLVNVLRKLGGRAEARNRREGGASVTITLPLAAIAYPVEEA